LRQQLVGDEPVFVQERTARGAYVQMCGEARGLVRRQSPDGEEWDLFL
jgi:hypothetical protein